MIFNLRDQLSAKDGMTQTRSLVGASANQGSNGSDHRYQPFLFEKDYLFEEINSLEDFDHNALEIQKEDQIKIIDQRSHVDNLV